LSARRPTLDPVRLKQARERVFARKLSQEPLAGAGGDGPAALLRHRRSFGEEDAFDADAVGDLADRERGARSAAVLADHDALEDLHALLVAFLDLHVHAHRVSRGKRGYVGPLHLGQQSLNDR
jgi:hypothetical protein